MNSNSFLSEIEVKAKYSAMLNGFYQLTADKLAAISMQDREASARQNTIAFFKRRDGITITEEQLLALLD